MKFKVGDEIITKELRKRGKVIQTYYKFEFNKGKFNEEIKYLVEFKGKTSVIWLREDAIELIHKDEKLKQVEIFLLDSLINQSLDNKDKESFTYYTTLKKELMKDE